MTVPPGSSSSGEIPTAVIAAVTVLILAILGSIVYLTANGKPVDNIMLLIAAIVAPTVASLIAVRKLTDVQSKVNGKVDNLITDKSNLEAQVANAGLTPITLKAAFDPASNTAPLRKITPDMTNPMMPQVDPGGKHSGGSNL